MQKKITGRIKEEGYKIGFELIGIAPVDDYPESQFYKKWLSRGFEAAMSYMSKNSEKREDARNIMPNARSVISCAINYNSDYPYSTSSKNTKKGWISRYAWGDDYHTVMKDKLNRLKDFIEKNTGYKDSLTYVDTGPVLERMYSKYSGVGWTGKNTCTINQYLGSWLFLGEIITSMELEYDSPVPDRCGTCTKCIDECPTEAIRKPYVIDSSRCISYLTIENKNEISYEYREAVGNNVFGCDICQDVCPWNNRKAPTTKNGSFLPRKELYQPELEYLLGLDQKTFSEIFKNSPIKRTKRKGLVRNTLVAIGNTQNSKYIDLLHDFIKDDDPIIRRHAIWALWKIQGRKCLKSLRAMIETEQDEDVITELNNILEMG